MAYILHIETTSTNCSVAVSRDYTLIALNEDNGANYSHSERLHVYIEEALNKARIRLDQLNAVAISEGPGSYTGLRIGVSAAKGICYALDIPLIAVPTLQSLARHVSPQNGRIISMLDARRMEAYTAVFDTEYNALRETRAEVITESSFEHELSQGQVHFVGTANQKARDVIDHPNAVFSDSEHLPSAQHMIPVGFSRFKDQSFADLAYFEPYYLKDFIAIKPKN